MLRRDFLKLSGVFLAAAGFPGLLTACHSGHKSGADFDGFPQGVASGDPRPESVVIWTRALPIQNQQKQQVTAEVSLDEAFTQLVLQKTFDVSAASDYTLKIVVNNLKSDTFYFYRFIHTTGQVSPTGRTLTAPALDDSREIQFAFVSCQNREHGFYGAYRQMIEEDRKEPVEKRIRFVLHLGDFIYETSNDPLMRPLNSTFNRIDGGLIDQNGQRRGVGPFPDGGTTPDGIAYARTVADYRHVYQEYMADPDLQEARARWPFIYIWDDHEFSDDCWESEANYNDASSTDEPSQPRRVAASQAWFEYTPVNLLHQGDIDPDLGETKAFEFAEVHETPNVHVDDSNFADNGENIKAIDTISIYRSFRFGMMLELAVTDNRSYRSDHAAPEEITSDRSVFVHSRMVMPLELVNLLDAGKTANGGDPNSFIFAGSLLINPRFNRPPGTILGKKQKAWWKALWLQSEARWKIWGNSVPLMRFLINLSALGTRLPDVVLSTDSWDGYASERNELMAFLRSNHIQNVVSLSGDYHAHFAGTVLDNYDVKPPETGSPAMTEFVCGGISSVSLFAVGRQLSERENPTADEKLLQTLIRYDATPMDQVGENPIVNNLNNTLLNGVAAGLAAAETHSRAAIGAAKSPEVNRHLKYADTDGHGFGWVSVGTEAITVKLVTISGINKETAGVPPGIRTSANFTVPFGQAEVSDPLIDGEPPFPL
ncbi:MAG: alkaline phosphatase D family protein [Nitrospirae bacterium]|nr:alkaline phosphatase D family protein [Candidatus Manganitrophaceae bacterium]